MASRFYPNSTYEPDFTITPDSSWDETAAVVYRKLAIDAPPNTSQYVLESEDTDTIAAPANYLLFQFISEPLDSISATLAVSQACFQVMEFNTKLNAFTYIVFRKCDSDGGNPVTVGSITDDVEWDDSINCERFVGSANLTDQAFSQGDRLVIEVGFYSSATKAGGYIGRMHIVDGSNYDDLLASDGVSGSYGISWIETGDTFTVASGDPPAAIKLGPMFAFA